MAPAGSDHEKTDFSKQAGKGIIQDLKEWTFCDMELICRGRRIPVHKAVVCTQSIRIWEAVSQYLCEHGKADFIPCRIDGRNGQTVEFLVEYLYTGEYSYSATDEDQAKIYEGNLLSIEQSCLPRRPSKKRDSSTLLPHVDMLAVADKYIVEGLAAKAVEYFRAELLALKDTPKFFEVIPAVYALQSKSSRLLRQECVQTTRSCFGSAMAVGQTNRQLLDDALALTPEFAKELLSACVVISEPSRRKCEEPRSSVLEENDSSQRELMIEKLM